MKNFNNYKKLPSWLKSSLPKTLPEKAFKNFGLNDFRKKVSIGLSDKEFSSRRKRILSHKALKKCGENTKYVKNVFKNIKFKNGRLQSEVFFEMKYHKTLNTLLKSVISFVKRKFDNIKIKRFNGDHYWYEYSNPKQNFLKMLNSLLIRTNRFTLVFSTNYWDIATMSMRGISSCQSWTGSYRHRLIGSIIDPCCAILYLTNGTKTKYGEKMVARKIVRLVKNINTNKFELLGERSYGKNIINKFVPKLKGIYNQNQLRPVYIPKHISLKKISPENYSYRDSGIGYTNRYFHTIETKDELLTLQ